MWPLQPLDSTPLSSRVQTERSGAVLACQARLMEVGQCDTDRAIEKGRAEKMGFRIKQRNKRLKTGKWAEGEVEIR